LSEKDILEKLLIDEEEILKRLVEKAEKIFRIDRKTGDAVIVAPKSKLIDRELIGITLLGRYFANKMKLASSDSMSVSEIAQKLGMDEKAVSARLSELKRERIVEMVSRGEYRVSYAGVESMLSEIEGKLST